MSLNASSQLSFITDISSFLANGSLSITKLSDLTSFNPNNFTSGYSYNNLTDVPNSFPINVHTHEIDDI
jgi:hypothetical protein